LRKTIKIIHETTDYSISKEPTVGDAMPTIDIDYYPELTRHELSTMMRRDFHENYSVYIGSRLQSRNIIVSDNDWVGAAVNIRQQQGRNLTSLNVRATVPAG
jgi:hypothetical protein